MACAVPASSELSRYTSRGDGKHLLPLRGRENLRTLVELKWFFFLFQVIIFAHAAGMVLLPVVLTLLGPLRSHSTGAAALADVEQCDTLKALEKKREVGKADSAPVV